MDIWLRGWLLFLKNRGPTERASTWRGQNPRHVVRETDFSCFCTCITVHPTSIKISLTLTQTLSESPIKRSSVKGNTSPGQENHRFLAEVQRLCCVPPPSEPFLRLCRDVSRMVSGDLRCRSLPHLSPIRIKASTPLGVGPLPHLADQKIFGSMPCPRVFSQISWL
jgi:hypothetical protein